MNDSGLVEDSVVPRMFLNERLVVEVPDAIAGGVVVAAFPLGGSSPHLMPVLDAC